MNSVLKNPMHPGLVLKELYLLPLGLSPMGLAKRLGVPRTRIERLVKGETGMTSDTAMRLGRFFSTTAHYWMNLQVNHDLAKADKAFSTDEIKPLETS